MASRRSRKTGSFLVVCFLQLFAFGTFDSRPCPGGKSCISVMVQRSRSHAPGQIMVAMTSIALAIRSLRIYRKDGHSRLVDDAGIKKRHSADSAVPEGNTGRLKWASRSSTCKLLYWNSDLQPQAGNESFHLYTAVYSVCISENNPRCKESSFGFSNDTCIDPRRSNHKFSVTPVSIPSIISNNSPQTLALSASPSSPSIMLGQISASRLDMNLPCVSGANTPAIRVRDPILLLLATER